MYVLCAWEFRQNNAHSLEFWCLSSALTLWVCAFDASKSQCACIILSKSLAKVNKQLLIYNYFLIQSRSGQKICIITMIMESGCQKLCTAEVYRIHSNKRLGHLDKSFQVGAYLFQFMLQGSTKKFMILAKFRLIANHIDFSMLVTWIDVGQWLIILWFIASKYNGWTLIGAWAAIRTNMVLAI